VGGVDRASFCRRWVGGGVEGGRVEEGGERVEGEREGRRQKSGGRKEGRKVSSSSNETKVVEGRKPFLTLNHPSALNLSVVLSAVLTPEAHHDDLSEERDRSQKKSSDSLQSKGKR